MPRSPDKGSQLNRCAYPLVEAPARVLRGDTLNSSDVILESGGVVGERGMRLLGFSGVGGVG